MIFVIINCSEWAAADGGAPTLRQGSCWVGRWRDTWMPCPLPWPPRVCMVVWRSPLLTLQEGPFGVGWSTVGRGHPLQQVLLECRCVFQRLSPTSSRIFCWTKVPSWLGTACFVGPCSYQDFCHVCVCWLIGLGLFSCSVTSSSLRPHGLQLARLPCPPPSPRVCSTLYALSQWCHPTASPSVLG